MCVCLWAAWSLLYCNWKRTISNSCTSAKRIAWHAAVVYTGVPWLVLLLSFPSKTSRNMINALPDLVLALIFNFLSETEKIYTATLACRKWYNVIHSSTVWKKVDFDFQRRITSDILEKFVYAGTRSFFERMFWFWPGLVTENKLQFLHTSRRYWTLGTCIFYSWATVISPALCLECFL